MKGMPIEHAKEMHLSRFEGESISSIGRRMGYNKNTVKKYSDLYANGEYTKILGNIEVIRRTKECCEGRTISEGLKIYNSKYEPVTRNVFSRRVENYGVKFVYERNQCFIDDELRSLIINDIESGRFKYLTDIAEFHDVPAKAVYNISNKIGYVASRSTASIVREYVARNGKSSAAEISRALKVSLSSVTSALKASRKEHRDRVSAVTKKKKSNHEKSKPDYSPLMRLALGLK